MELRKGRGEEVQSQLTDRHFPVLTYLLYKVLMANMLATRAVLVLSIYVDVPGPLMNVGPLFAILLAPCGLKTSTICVFNC